MKDSKSGPRRSHALGACRTCKRRHVKCDQKRPTCRTCRTLNVTCERSAGEVRWMRDGNGSGSGNSNGVGSDDTHYGEIQVTRRHLYTGRYRMSRQSLRETDLARAVEIIDECVSR